MKKISFLIGSLGGGGAERVTVALADYFCESGYEVFFIVFSKANNNYRINPKIKIDYLPENTGKCAIFFRIKELKKLLKNQAPDYVISLGLGYQYLILGNLLNKYRFILSERNAPQYYYNWYQKIYVKYSYEKAYRIIGLPSVLIILMLVMFFFAPAQDFWLLRQRYEYKYKLAGALTMGSALASTIFSVIVVLYLNKAGSDQVVVGRLYATNIATMAISAVIWIKIYAKGKTIVNIKYWKYSLKLSAPLIGYAFAAQILSVSDRMMISKMVGNDAVGIYSTLYTVSSISLLVWSAINSSFIPYLYQNISKKDNKIRELSLALMGSYAIIAVMLTFLAPEIVRILATKEYYEAIYIMPPIAAGVFLTSVSNMYSNLLIYHKKTNYIMYRVGKPDESNSGEIKCMALVRMIYVDSGWDKKMSYRLIGRAFPQQRLVSFKITDAMQIENGRVLTEM